MWNINFGDINFDIINFVKVLIVLVSKLIVCCYVSKIVFWVFFYWINERIIYLIEKDLEYGFVNIIIDGWFIY